MSATHVVKLKRTGFETIVASGDLATCEAEASLLDADYQTDEYQVEPRRASEPECPAAGALKAHENGSER